MLKPRALLVLCLLLTLVGCGSHARVLSVDVRATEKDVLVLSVELEHPLDPEGYLEWASNDLALKKGDPENPFFQAPVYELLYSFHSSSLQLATVLYRRSEAGQGSLVHQRTLVYDLPRTVAR